MPSMARIDPFASPPPRSISANMESLFLNSSPDFGPVKAEVNKVRAIGDMTAPAVPNTGYRDRSMRLRHLEDDKNALIDDLIRQVETTQHQLQQCRLDQEREAKYNNESSMREQALEDEMAGIRSLLDRNAYATVLINGDTLTFAKEFWKKGERGGQEAAHALSDAINTFSESNLPSMTTPKVHIKLFINVRSLTETLCRYKFLDQPCLVQSFLCGLLSSDVVFDVIDTSLVQGLTMKKLKESYRHDFVNVHCHQVFLAATADHELNTLLSETPDIPIHERLTLLEANNIATTDKFSQECQSIKMDSLLVKIPTESLTRPPPPVKIATPVLARIDSNSSMNTVNTGHTSPKSTPGKTWAAMTAQPFIPKPGEAQFRASTPSIPKAPPLSRTTTVADVPRNKLGQRFDKVDDSIPYQELQRIKKMKLCNIYYLQGKGACDGSCNHSHTYNLKTHEKNILKEVARMTPCYYKLDCDDPNCIYGHRCPQSKPGKSDCYYKSDCRFIGWGHGIDDKIVKTQNIK